MSATTLAPEHTCSGPIPCHIPGCQHRGAFRFSPNRTRYEPGPEGDAAYKADLAEWREWYTRQGMAFVQNPETQEFAWVCPQHRHTRELYDMVYGYG